LFKRFRKLTCIQFVNYGGNVVPEDVEQTVRSLGEHAAIELMRRYFELMPDVVVPFGDDVSALPLSDNDLADVAVLKADMLVAATDVPQGMNMWQAARKAIVMNVSDFAAKGVAPRAVLTSLGLPGALRREDLVALAKGLNAAAREYGAYVVGGDTGAASDLIISIQLYGSAKKSSLMLRGGTTSGDILAVTGFFGKSAAGLRLLQDKRFAASDAIREALVDSVYMPAARLREGLALAASGAVSSSIDSSDGLAWCLHELSVQSKVGFVVSALPIAPEVVPFADLNGLNAAELVLFGGEEYELVITVKPELWSKAVRAVETVGGKLLRIGKATSDRQVVLEVDGELHEIAASGYEHFKS
jgi:thiamine-monophosphate kinase